jgi:O-antigen/teichoic acid export membrane protein
MIKKIYKQAHNAFFKSEFNSNVLTLMTGNIIAQAIPIAITPILTRLYTPKDFGVLALFLAITSIIVVIASLRYELAIVQPHSDKDAAALVVLSATIATVISLLFLVVIHVFNRKLQLWLDSQEVGPWLYLVPACVFIQGLYQPLNYWHTRKKLFKSIGINKVNQAASTAAVQVSAGLGAIGSAGLILGNILGQLIALLTLIKKSSGDYKKNFRKVKYAQIKLNAIHYQKLAKYSTFGSLADNTSLQMPILVISKFYDMMQTGMFSLTFRVLSLPTSLLSNALSQVLFQKVSKMHHDSPSKIKAVILKLFFILLVIMIPFIGFIGLFGEDLFVIVFGESWRVAGEMAAILVVAVAIRFAVSPLSSVLALDHNVKIGVLWQFIYLITITTTLFYFSSFSIDSLLYAFVVHEVLLYLLYLLLILKSFTYLKVN